MCLIRLCVLSYSGRTLSPANPVLNSRFIGLPIMKYQLMMVLGRNRRVQGLMCVLEQDQKHGEYILLFWQKIPFQISKVNLFCLCIFSLQPTPSVGLWASQSNIVLSVWHRAVPDVWDEQGTHYLRVQREALKGWGAVALRQKFALGVISVKNVACHMWGWVVGSGEGKRFSCDLQRASWGDLWTILA